MCRIRVFPAKSSPQQARANALQLVRQYPDAFAGHDVEDAIQNDMMLFYFPMALADLRMMASFPGKGLSKETLVYYEVLDWAYPRANYLDVRLMGILEPWDFAKVGPFDPAMPGRRLPRRLRRCIYQGPGGH